MCLSKEKNCYQKHAAHHNIAHKSRHTDTNIKLLTKNKMKLKKHNRIKVEQKAYIAKHMNE